MESTFEQLRSGLYIPKKLGKLLSNFSAFRRLGDPLFNRLGVRGLPWGFGQRVGGVSFLPTDIADLRVWLKAGRITGLNDGDAVATWSDLSGNGNDATQATGAKQPLYQTNIVNGEPIVRGDGVNDILDFGTPDILVGQGSCLGIVVAELRQAIGGGAGITGMRQNVGFAYGFNGNEEWGGFVNSGAWEGDFSPAGATTGLNDGVFRIYELQYNGIDLRAFINGTLDSIPDAAVVGNLGVGAAASIFGRDDEVEFLQHDIAEFLMYAPLPNTDDITNLRNYLGSEFGISA